MSKSVKSNIIFKLILNLLNLVIPILVGPYLARILDVDLYGEYNSAIGMLEWFLPFASFGIYNYGVRQVAQVRNNKIAIQRIFNRLLIMGGISSISIFMLYLIYVNIFIPQVFHMLYFIMSIQILACAFMAEWVNEAYEDYSFILYKTIIIRVLYILGIFIFIKKPTDIIVYALIYSLSQFINNLISFLHITRKIGFSRVYSRDLKPLILPLVIMLLLTNSTMLYAVLDKLFLILFCDKKYVTYYMFALGITSMIGNLVRAITAVTIPRLSYYLANKKTEEYKNLMRLSSELFFLIVFPVCMGIVVLSTPIIFIYAGEKYISAGACLALYGIRTILSMCDWTMANQIIFIHGYESRLTKYYFIGGSINLSLNFLLVVLNIISPETVIITTVAADCVLIYLENNLIKKEISKDYQLWNIRTIKYLFLSALFLPVNFIIKKIYGYTIAFEIRFIVYCLINIVSCAFIYIGALALTKDKTFLYVFNTIKNKIKSTIVKVNISK